MDVWRLVVFTSTNGCMTVHGTQKAIQEQYDLMTEAVEALDGTRSPFVSLSGYMDRLDRSPIHMSCKVEDIRGFNMERY